MKNFEIIILVFALLIALLAIADKFKIPSPILLVVVGLTLGFIPAMPSFVLNPKIVFLLFLPPVLYDAASHTSWHEFKSEIKPITTLAIALVFGTTVSVALVSYFLIPGFSWPMAFVLGAIVSPPDAVAATSITKGLKLNRRVITILEGESLVNDASALIAYRFALAALMTGSFVLWEAGLTFAILVIGGILSGIAIGYLFIIIHKEILNNSIISTSLTILAPFISYLTAELFHTSGVLAVVSTSLLISWRAPEIFSYHTRIRNRAVWDTAIFLLNGFIFILIGLQLPLILRDLGGYEYQELFAYGLAVSVVTIIVRILWIFSAAYSPLGRSMDSKKKKSENENWKNVMIMAWTGTRGIVSLATALALPLTLVDGSIFSQRSLILFLSFVVIFVTLVVQGVTLPLLISLLKVKSNAENDEIESERELRLLLSNATLHFVDNELQSEISQEGRIAIRKPLLESIFSLNKKSDSVSAKQSRAGIDPYLDAQQEVHDFQRRLLITLYKDASFSQTVFRRLEQELDHAELLTSKLSKKKKRF